MFYYLLYNSSFSFIVENRLFSTILYGSILYILTHAILNYCSIEILTIINHYFWIIFVLDIISLAYGTYLSFNNPSINNSQGHSSNDSQSNLSVSFNLLKNKINTLLDRKNDLTITHINTPSNQQNTSSQNQPQNLSQYIDNSNSNTNLNSNPNTNKLSTPISQLQKQKKQITPLMTNNTNTNNNDIPDSIGTTSTPINLIRTRINNIGADPIINEDIDCTTESVAGSDVGSVMDLDDFEKSL